MNKRVNFVPMDLESLKNLKPGREVLVRHDLGAEKVYTVKYKPWQLGHGTWVIGLNGIAGCYNLSRVIGVRP